MKELRNTVLIIIPVFNDIKDIDLTMQSIFMQDYDKNCIYITAVDFGSSDGSYEKLMEYPAFNFGLYQYKGNFTEYENVDVPDKYGSFQTIEIEVEYELWYKIIN